jgi:hypothetical protein
LQSHERESILYLIDYYKFVLLFWMLSIVTPSLHHAGRPGPMDAGIGQFGGDWRSEAMEEILRRRLPLF